jgi:hypothetical protein
MPQRGTTMVGVAGSFTDTSGAQPLKGGSRGPPLAGYTGDTHEARQDGDGNVVQQGGSGSGSGKESAKGASTGPPLAGYTGVAPTSQRQG